MCMANVVPTEQRHAKDAPTRFRLLFGMGGGGGYVCAGVCVIRIRGSDMQSALDSKGGSMQSVVPVAEFIEDVPGFLQARGNPCLASPCSDRCMHHSTGKERRRRHRRIEREIQGAQDAGAADDAAQAASNDQAARDPKGA